MSNILAQICEKKKIELELSKKRCSFSSLEQLIKEKRIDSEGNILLEIVNMIFSVLINKISEVISWHCPWRNK